MTLQVYQLQDVAGRQTKSKNVSLTDHTRLGPRQIWSDDKLDVPVTENAENHAPKIPLMKA